MKLKCDFQEPCGRCRVKSRTCKYTRDGYIDPYQEYRIDHGSAPKRAENESSAPSTSVFDSTPSMDAATVSEKGQSAAWQQNSLVWPAQREMSVTHPTLPHLSTDLNCHGTLDVDQLNLNQVPTDFCFDMNHDLSMNLSSASWFSEPLGQFWPSVAYEDIFGLTEEQASEATFPPTPVSPRRGFGLAQSDPVEAKCAAVRAMLQSPESTLSAELIADCMTREKILLCHQLYGTHFQYHYPILHAPTHQFTETSPVLLLAMILAGAHYSISAIKAADISKFALRLLMVIQTQPREMAMEAPDLSTLQACIIVCALLACSRDPIANQSWQIHFSRILSMLERMGAFGGNDFLQYDDLSVETFDWAACQAFCQDMASCIYFGKPPALSPRSCNVVLPCYESAWEAGTAAECLQRLQSLPKQLSIPTALRMLHGKDAETIPRLEASGYGMFVLIQALHGFIFHLTREQIVPLYYARKSGPHSSVGTPQATSLKMLMGRLKRDFSGRTVEAVSDEVIKLHTGTAFHEVNSALNAWRVAWDGRNFRDNDSDAKNFSADPLPFWQLAKLFLLLHLVGEDRSMEGELNLPRARAGDPKSKLIVQEKIVSWLQKLRVEKPEEVEQESREANAQNAADRDGSRVLLLMRPL